MKTFTRKASIRSHHSNNTRTFFLPAFFLLFLLFQNTAMIAQQPNYLWAKKAPGASIKTAVCTDMNGNLFMTGDFSTPTATFGANILVNAGVLDCFVVKYNPAGNVLWAKQLSGAQTEWGVDICTDNSGNVFVTGYSNSSSLTIGAITLTNNSSSDMFLVKYDASGNVLWATSGINSGISYETSNSICTDANGNVLITGRMANGIVTFGSHTLYSNNSGDCFLVKYDPSGNALWATSIDGGQGIETGIALAADASGNVFLAGDFNSATLSIGSFTFTNSDNNSFPKDIFLAKYDAAGNVLWARSSGGPGNDRIADLTVNTAGSIVMAGNFQSGGQYRFLEKYDAAGNVLWAKSGNAPYAIIPQGIVSDPLGNLLITGSTDTLAVFGQYTLTTHWPSGFFLAKYAASGNLKWAASNDGPGNCIGLGICADASGNTFVEGNFSPSILFGPFSLNGAATDPDRRFITKLDSATAYTGLRENTASGHFNVYPNPGQDVFYIESLASISGIEVINALGETVHAEILPAHEQGTALDLSRQPDGVYVLKISAGAQSVCKKIMLSR